MDIDEDARRIVNPWSYDERLAAHVMAYGAPQGGFGQPGLAQQPMLAQQTFGMWVDDADIIPRNTHVFAKIEGEWAMGVVLDHDDGRYIIRITEGADGGVYSAEDDFTERVRAADVRRIDAPPTARVPHGGARITHSYDQRGARASEYVAPGGQIEITNHGLGSGVYGLAPGHNLQPSTPWSVEHQMQNPFLLEDAAHGTAITSASKEMQRLCEREIRGQNEEDLATLVRLWNHAMLLAGKPALSAMQLRLAINAFKQDYRQTAQAGLGTTAQPINYLMQMIGCDGIYGTNRSDNSFGRGCVLYAAPGNYAKTTKGDRLK